MDVEEAIALSSDDEGQETQRITTNGDSEGTGASNAENGVVTEAEAEVIEMVDEENPEQSGETNGEVEVMDTFDTKWRGTRPSLTEKFAFALENKRVFHDVSFAVGDEGAVMSAHKTILAINSPVFEDLFHGPKHLERDEAEAIILADLEANAFRATLKFMYTGLFEVDLIDAVGVLRAAKMFDLPLLLEKTGEFLIRNLTEQNAITFYQAAEVFGVKNLEESACSFLLNNFWAVANTEDFLNITLANLCKFLDMDEINISELEFFNAALRWAKAQCDKQAMKDTSENMRAVLEDGIQLVRFTLMSPKEFALQVVPKFILTPVEVITIFQHLSVDLEERETLPAVFCKSESRKKLKYSSSATSKMVENVKATRLRVRIRPCDRFAAAVKTKEPPYTPPATHYSGSSSSRKRSSMN